jgi:hypothetical protein
LGTVTGGPIQCTNTPTCGHEVQKFDLASNDFRLGLRYLFADVPPPAPYYQPPLVRKY